MNWNREKERMFEGFKAKMAVKEAEIGELRAEIRLIKKSKEGEINDLRGELTVARNDSLDEVEKLLSKIERVKDEANVDAVNMSRDIDLLRQKLPKKKVSSLELRYSQQLVVAPGWQVNEYVQYPAELICDQQSLQDIQPFRLGVKTNSLITQLG